MKYIVLNGLIAQNRPETLIVDESGLSLFNTPSAVGIGKYWAAAFQKGDPQGLLPNETWAHNQEIGNLKIGAVSYLTHPNEGLAIAKGIKPSRKVVRVGRSLKDRCLSAGEPVELAPGQERDSVVELLHHFRHELRNISTIVDIRNFADLAGDSQVTLQHTPRRYLARV